MEDGDSRNGGCLRNVYWEVDFFTLTSRCEYELNGTELQSGRLSPSLESSKAESQHTWRFISRLVFKCVTYKYVFFFFLKDVTYKYSTMFDNPNKTSNNNRHSIIGYTQQHV